MSQHTTLTEMGITSFESISKYTLRPHDGLCRSPHFLLTLRQTSKAGPPEPTLQ